MSENTKQFLIELVDAKIRQTDNSVRVGQIGLVERRNLLKAYVLVKRELDEVNR